MIAAAVVFVLCKLKRVYWPHLHLCSHPTLPAKRNLLEGLHFYTLNLERSVRLILDGLGYTETAATRRMYPWRASALSKRAAEDVR